MGRMAGVRRLPVRAMIFGIELYRVYISPMRLPSCRFMPTCSQYAVEALTEFGLVRGSWLTALRLAKCGPWHRGGWDPIPERRSSGGDRVGAATGESGSGGWAAVSGSMTPETGRTRGCDGSDDGRVVRASRGESESVV